jgi:hypothetical protein
MARRYLQALGGRIRAENRVGRGLMVSSELPPLVGLWTPRLREGRDVGFRGRSYPRVDGTDFALHPPHAVYAESPSPMAATGRAPASAGPRGFGTRGPMPAFLRGHRIRCRRRGPHWLSHTSMSGAAYAAGGSDRRLPCRGRSQIGGARRNGAFAEVNVLRCRSAGQSVPPR